MNVLVVDVGGTNVKVLATGQNEPRGFPSGPKLEPKQMVARVKQIAGDWKYDVVAMGYPGRVLHDMPVAEPRNLGGEWVGFNFKNAFGLPVKILNDAACRLSEATKVDCCSSWVWGPVSVPHSSMKEFRCLWN
jgi:polyphosphate glucokinase